MDMTGNRSRAWTWMTAVVLAHLLVAIVHGIAHTQAQVPLSPTQNLFVLLVILAGPLIGLALTWPAPRFGSWIVAITMAGAFIFGLVNHFVFVSPDHVAHVDPHWRPLFATTAVLLAVLELLGAVLAIRFARERKSS